MKIALITESPTLATGFGTRARALLTLLAALGHETVVFAISAREQPFDPADFPARIVPLVRDQLETIGMVGPFLAAEQPDLLLVHYDLATACWYIERARRDGWQGPVVAHIVMDNLPVSRRLLDVLRSIDAAITPTETAARYCREHGAAHVIAAPYAVDPTIFRPLPHRDELRRAAGLADRFVVGVFGRNMERKQQPRVMLALRDLLSRGAGEDVVLYLHCQPEQDDPWLSTWNLREVAEQLGIADRVLFPPPDFRQLRGVPYHPDPDRPALAAAGAPATPAVPPSYSYVERLNLCDLVVNAPSGGAFELIALEAQLCGVPLAVTNDGGAIVEVAGDGALLLDPVDVAIQSSGGRQYLVGARTIADAVQRVRQDPHLRDDLVRRGFANAERYRDDRMTAAIRQALATAVRHAGVGQP